MAEPSVLLERIRGMEERLESLQLAFQAVLFAEAVEAEEAERSPLGAIASSLTEFDVRHVSVVAANGGTLDVRRQRVLASACAILDEATRRLS